MTQNKKGTRQERMPLKSEEREKERFVPFPFLLHQNLMKILQKYHKFSEITRILLFIEFKMMYTLKID